MSRPHPVAWLRAHPDVGDAVLGSLVCAASIVTLFASRIDPGNRSPGVADVVFVVLATLPIAVRRRFPASTLAFVTANQIVLNIWLVDGAGWVGPLIALYSVGANLSSGRRRTTILTMFGTAVTLLFVLGRITHQVDWGSIAGTYVTLPTAFVLGDNLRRRRERLADLAERAERTEREQELLAKERVSEERARIARELHDVVAHSVSVMVIQAGAARRQLGVDPARATEALTAIESTGRDAMQEMRRILGVLRDDTAIADLAPQPSLEGIEALIAADPSLPTRYYVRGEPHPVPTGVELSAYRIVQEALTNVRKHAGRCSKVTVAVLYRGDHLELLVHDNGRGAATPNGAEPGHGLVGMKERVAACGGELRVGPARGGGWRVRARFPIGPALAATA